MPEYIKLTDAQECIKDYLKQLITEGNEKVEITEFNAEIQKRLVKAPITDVVEVIKRIKQIVCDYCYPDFNKDGKPINVWEATNGYEAIDNFLKELAGVTDE